MPLPHGRVELNRQERKRYITDDGVLLAEEVIDDEWEAVNAESTDALLPSNVVTDRNFALIMPADMRNAIFENELTANPEAYWHKLHHTTKFSSLQHEQVPKKLSASSQRRADKSGAPPETTAKHTRVTFSPEPLVGGEDMVRRIKEFIMQRMHGTGQNTLGIRNWNNNEKPVIELKFLYTRPNATRQPLHTEGPADVWVLILAISPRVVHFGGSRREVLVNLKQGEAVIFDQTQPHSGAASGGVALLAVVKIGKPADISTHHTPFYRDAMGKPHQDPLGNPLQVYL